MIFAFLLVVYYATEPRRHPLRWLFDPTPMAYAKVPLTCEACR